MKRLTIALAALLCACATQATEAPPLQLDAVALPISDVGGNRMEALIEQSGGWCSADGVWCVTRGEDAVSFTQNGQTTQLLTFDDDTGRPEVWPAIIRERGDAHVLIGLGWTQYDMYSGGGAQFTRTTLYRITRGSDLIPEVLTFPSGSGLSIRACFSEEDTRARRDACHDQYDFAGELSLDTTNTATTPHLRLRTLATSFPGVRSRNSDSTTEAPLQPSDLRAVRDETCSYEASFTFNGESFAEDAPLPACEDYLEP